MKVKDEVLRCSECDCDWTQPYQVEVFNRASEDNDKGLHVTIAGQVITQADDVSRDAGNPSKRGSGIRLLFRCERCSALTGIVMVQHKGQTLMHRHVGLKRIKTGPPLPDLA